MLLSSMAAHLCSVFWPRESSALPGPGWSIFPACSCGLLQCIFPLTLVEPTGWRVGEAAEAARIAQARLCSPHGRNYSSTHKGPLSMLLKFH